MIRHIAEPVGPYKRAEPGLSHLLKLREGESLPLTRLSIAPWLTMSNDEKGSCRRAALPPVRIPGPEHT